MSFCPPRSSSGKRAATASLKAARTLNGALTTRAVDIELRVFTRQNIAAIHAHTTVKGTDTDNQVIADNCIAIPTAIKHFRSVGRERNKLASVLARSQLIAVSLRLPAAANPYAVLVA